MAIPGSASTIFANEKNDAENLSTIFEHTPKRRPRGLAEVHIEARKIAMLYYLGYRWGNILSLTEAILHHLQTGQYYEPFTFPVSDVQKPGVSYSPLGATS